MLTHHWPHFTGEEPGWGGDPMGTPPHSLAQALLEQLSWVLPQSKDGLPPLNP